MALTIHFKTLFQNKIMLNTYSKHTRSTYFVMQNSLLRVQDVSPRILEIKY